MQSLERLMKENDVVLEGARVLVLKSRDSAIDQWFRDQNADVVAVREDWHAADASHHLQPEQAVFMPAEGYLCAAETGQFDYIFTFHTHPTQTLCENRRRLLKFGGKAFIVKYDCESMTVAEEKDPGFVISSYPRCGTHMIVTALSQNPALTVFGEVFVSDSDNGKHGLGTVPQVLEAFWRSPYHGFAAHAYIGHPNNAIFAPTPKFQGLWNRMPQGVKMISLRRRDLLARHVSHLQAKQTNVWNKFDGDRPPPPRVAVGIDSLYRDAKSAKRIWSKVDKRFPHRHVVYYEDMCEHPEREYRLMQEYLGVQPVPVAPTSIKLGVPVEKSVTNYADVVGSMKTRGEKKLRGDA